MVLITPPAWMITILLPIVGIATGYIVAKLLCWFPDFFLSDNLKMIFKIIIPLFIWIWFVIIHIDCALLDVSGLNLALARSIGITIFVLEFLLPAVIIYNRTFKSYCLKHKLCHA